jgi:hypothetical protein
MKVIAAIGFFVGVFFLAVGYTTALSGAYPDCFAAGMEAGCGFRFFGAPTLSSVLYGPLLAVVALITCELGTESLRWLRRASPQR